MSRKGAPTSLVGKRRSHRKPKRPTIERGTLSHWTKHGQPKVSYLTEESAIARAEAHRPPANVYRCGEYGCWHVGGVAS